MNSVDQFAKTLNKIIEDRDSKKPTPKDDRVTVTKVEGDTVWVHFPGGVDETPVQRTLDAKVGDTVTVRRAEGKAWITGNNSNPPTDDSTANYAVNIANETKKDVTVLNTVVTESIEATNARFGNVEADTAKIHDLTADQLTATVGYIGDLTADDITAGDIIADHATIDDLDVTYAQIDMANVNNAWIENGAIKKAEVFDENVFDLSGNKATIARIDASKINVANLNADNLIVRRINGQPVVGGYTLVSNTSPGYESKNPQALGWYEFVNAQWVLSTDTTVDTTKAYYQEGNEVSLYDQAYIDGLENDLQQQIDGAVETFTGMVVPTLVNYPYTDWYDTSVTPVHDERAKHVGDIYYVVNSASDQNGYCYRFAYDNTQHAYSWVLIKDSDVTKALSDISDLQTFESETTSWIEETDQGLETIRTNYTNLSGRVDDVEDTANAALPAADFQVFESTTFTDLVDEVDEQSTTMQNMTTRLGLNSDGTGSTTDIVAKESALEQTVNGITSRVSATETKLIGMYATSSTAAGTAAKVATITPAIPSGTTWTLGTGTTVTVKFTTDNTTASPTLNINGTGAKPIKTYANGNLSEAEYKWKAGSTFTFTYNGTNWLMQDSTASVRMTSAETSITQNANAIKLEASTREKATNMLLDTDVPSLTKVNALYDRYWSDAGQASWCTPSIVEISDPPTQGIKYACRFVATASDHTADNKGRAIAFYNASDTSKALPLKVGTKYTVSYWARCTSGQGRAWVWYAYKKNAAGTDNQGRAAVNITDVTSTWKYFTGIVELESETLYNRIWFYAYFPANTAGTVEICGMKLVAGDNIESYSTKIEQTANNVLIQATASDTTAAQGGQHLIESLINVAPSGVTINANKVNINGTTVFNDGTSIQSRINAIDIGGRNLFGYGSQCESLGGFTSSGTWDIRKEDGFICAHTSGAIQQTRHIQSKLPFTPKPGETMTFSVFVKIKNISYGTTNPMCELYFSGATIDSVWRGFAWKDVVVDGEHKSYTNNRFTSYISDTKWHKIEVTATFNYTGTSTIPNIAPAIYLRDATGDLYVRDIKYERGNKATDWTPAPEDIPTTTNENLVRGSRTMTVGGYGYMNGHWRASGGTVSNLSFTAGSNPPNTDLVGFIRSTNTGDAAAQVGLCQDVIPGGLNGGIYTISAWVRRSTEGSLYCRAFYFDGTHLSTQSPMFYNVGTNWQKVSWTGTISGGDLDYYSGGYFYAGSIPVNGYLDVCGVKIERGPIPTEWTPAPSDDGVIQKAVATGFLKETGVTTTVSNNDVTITYTGTNTAHYGAYYNFPCEPNTTYDIMFWHAAPTNTWWVGVGYDSSVWTGLHAYRELRTTSARESIRVRTPDNATFIRVYFSTTSGNGSSIRIGELSLISDNINAASKTATSYITQISASDGVKIHDSADTSDYVQINSSKIAMYRNNVEKMQLTDSVFRIGEASGKPKVNITATDVEMYTSDNIKRVNINSSSGVIVGRSDKGHTVVTDTGLYVYDSSGTRCGYFTGNYAVLGTETAGNFYHYLYPTGFQVRKQIDSSTTKSFLTISSSWFCFGDPGGTRITMTVDGDSPYLYMNANGVQCFNADKNGVVIGNPSSAHSWVKSDGLHVWTGADSTATNEVAFFGATARIGKPTSANTGNVYIDNDSVDIRKGSTLLSTFTATGASIGRNSTTATIDLLGNALKITGRYETLISSNDTFVAEMMNQSSSSIKYMDVGVKNGGYLRATDSGVCLWVDGTEYSTYIEASKYGSVTLHPAGNSDLKLEGYGVVYNTYDINDATIGVALSYEDSSIGFFNGTSIGAAEPSSPYLHGLYSDSLGEWIIGIDGDPERVFAPQIYTKTSSSGSNVRVVTSGKGYLYRYVSSSRRYKEDIEDLTDNELAAERLYNLRPVQFRYKEDYLDYDDARYGKLVPGFIAEEVEEAYPIAAQYEDEMVEDWETKFIIPPMLKLIQDQKKQLDEIGQRLDALERK